MDILIFKFMNETQYKLINYCCMQILKSYKIGKNKLYLTLLFMKMVKKLYILSLPCIYS